MFCRFQIWVFSVETHYLNTARAIRNWVLQTLMPSALLGPGLLTPQHDPHAVPYSWARQHLTIPHSLRSGTDSQPALWQKKQTHTATKQTQKLPHKPPNKQETNQPTPTKQTHHK